MNFATALSLSSGILLFNLPKQSGAGVDPYQRAAVFFILYLASTEIDSREGRRSGLTRLVQDDQALYFYEEKEQDILIVLSTTMLFSKPMAERITSGLAAILSASGMSTSSSPRESTIKVIEIEVQSLLFTTLADTMRELRKYLMLDASDNDSLSDFTLLICAEDRSFVSPESAIVVVGPSSATPSSVPVNTEESSYNHTKNSSSASYFVSAIRSIFNMKFGRKKATVTTEKACSHVSIFGRKLYGFSFNPVTQDICQIEGTERSIPLYMHSARAALLELPFTPSAPPTARLMNADVDSGISTYMNIICNIQSCHFLWSSLNKEEVATSWSLIEKMERAARIGRQTASLDNAAVVLNSMCIAADIIAGIQTLL